MQVGFGELSYYPVTQSQFGGVAAPLSGGQEVQFVAEPEQVVHL